MSIDVKLDKIIENIGEIKVVQAKQQVILQDHIRRTEILEKAISPTRIIMLLAALAAIIESLHWIMK